MLRIESCQSISSERGVHTAPRVPRTLAAAGVSIVGGKLNVFQVKHQNEGVY
jgi:hypothetical protein